MNDYKKWFRKTYSDSSKKDERNQLEKDPGLAILDVEEDRVLIAVRIDGSNDESGDKSAEEGAP